MEKDVENDKYSDKIKELAQLAYGKLSHIHSDEVFFKEEIAFKLSKKLEEIGLLREGIELQIPHSFILRYLEDKKEVREDLSSILEYSPNGGIELELDIRNLYKLDTNRLPEIVEFIDSLRGDDELIRKYAQIFWKKIQADDFIMEEDYNPRGIFRHLGGVYGSRFKFEERQFFLVEGGEKRYIGIDALREIIIDIIQEYIDSVFYLKKNELRENMIKGIAKEVSIDTAKKMEILLEKDEEEHLLEVLTQYYSALESNVVSTIGEILYLLSGDGKDIYDPEIILTIPKEVIVGWGIKRGTFYENAPWNLVRLGPEHLFREGFIMKHCVGNDTRYAAYVMTREIEIWSLRNKDGSPRFTFHIEGEWDNMYKEEREKSISQIKGKGNRLPGYESKQSTTIRFVDELIFLYNLFLDMGVDISRTSDIKEQIKMIGEENLR